MRILLLLLLGLSLVATETGYRIQPGDVLGIAVYGHADLSLQARVGADGSIAMPLVGRIAGLPGLGLAEAEQMIAARLLDGYLVEATVSVQLIEAVPKLVFVMGAVNRPGSIVLSPWQPMSSLEAIAQCGGFASDADRGGAVILRDHADSPGQFAHMAVPAADVPSLLLNDVVLRSGDLIVVPRHGRVFVIGRVRSPGAVPLLGEGVMTVSRAISMAGGFDTFAVDKAVQLIREGATEPIVVNVHALLSGEAGGEDPRLLPGDIISVPQSRF